jgi:hypothetical protein
MKKYIFSVFVLLLLSCDDKSKEVGLEKNFYTKIIDYQKKYPIPKVIKEYQKGVIYVYLVECYKEDNDTLITVGRFPAGISKSDTVYGVYKNEELQPTFIFDQSNLCDKLITKKIENKNNDKFYRSDKSTFPESFPPIFKYKLKNNKLSLVKIDSVWLKWD